MAVMPFISQFKLNGARVETLIVVGAIAILNVVAVAAVLTLLVDFALRGLGWRKPWIYALVCAAVVFAFYLAMTDLHIFAKPAGLRETEWERPGETYGWGNNRNLIFMKSWDLLNWTHHRVPVARRFPEAGDLGVVWAPQTIWDDKAGKLNSKVNLVDMELCSLSGKRTTPACREAATAYIDRYFTRYPGVKRYMDETRASAKERGYVETVFGRRLWLPEINSPNGPRRSGAERAAINAPMQGTAADLIKLSMNKVLEVLDKENRKTKMIMQVHDELVFEVPLDEVDWVRVEIPRLMAGVAQLKVPLLAETGVGENWEKAH